MRARLLAAVLIVTATTLLVPRPAQATQISDRLDQSNGVVQVGENPARTGALLAQTFTSGATANLTKVQLDLRHLAGFGATITRVDILATNAGTGAPEGSSLGFATVPAGQITDSSTCGIVDFTGLAVPVVAGTKYALVVSTDGDTDAHSVKWCHSGPGGTSTSNAYPDGAPWVSSGTWTAADAALDRRFATYVSFNNAVPACGDVGPVPTTVGSSVVIPFSCTDAETWQHLTYSRKTQAAHGTVAPASGPAGTLVYTPQPGFQGADQFTYWAYDGYEFSVVRTVTLVVGGTAPPPPPPPAAPPTISVTGKPKADPAKGTAQLTVTVSGPGTVTLSGKGVKTATVSVSQAGEVTLTVKPDAHTKKQLKSKHKATVTVTVTVTPAGSTAGSSSVTQKVKLKKQKRG